jgi:hypothetical protein
LVDVTGPKTISSPGCISTLVNSFTSGSFVLLF